MKLHKFMLLMAFFCLLSPLARGMDSKKPFSSPEEKRFILMVAGRDGQIDRDEWSRNQTDRDHFKNLNWDVLLNFDLDGDGSVGVNEFYRYVEYRMESAAKASEKPAEETAPDSVERPRPFSVSLAQNPQPASPAAFDRRNLFRRSQIAQRTKIQERADPEALRNLEQQRRKHLKVMTDRRRTAARNQPMTAAMSTSEIRDIYKAKLVKNRLTRPSAGVGSRRDSLMEARQRSALQNTDPNRRRNAAQDLRHRGSPVNNARERLESARRALRPVQVGTSGKSRSHRDASDIRGLIPPAPGTNDRTATPKKEPKRTPARTTNKGQSPGKTRVNGKR